MKKWPAFLIGLMAVLLTVLGVEAWRWAHPAELAVLPDGGRYNGLIVDGRAEGSGELHWPDGRHYKGEFRRGLFEGEGALTLANGDSYSGTFRGGLFHGPGVLTTADGEEYRGNFTEGELSGVGSYSDSEGNRYEGHFAATRFNGEGTYTAADGSVYRGEFRDGSLNGAGEYRGPDGEHYIGDFEYGYYHGEGALETAMGDRYEGSFHYGDFHGEGTLAYHKPLDGADGVRGHWRNGELVEDRDSDRPVAPSDIAETVLYNQNTLLEQHWSALEPQNPDAIDLYFLGIAGDGSQGVFRREVQSAREYFDRHLGTAGRSMLLINGGYTAQDIPMATRHSIEASLNAVSARMDPEQDILFLYMSSHGSREFDFQLTQRGVALRDLAGAELAAMLKPLPVRWKVVVVSACYSGGLIPLLQDGNTLIITAAAADRTSFGCRDNADFTYFGQAFIRDALPVSASFVEAFDRAVALVREREAAQDYEFSDPQIFRPAPVLQQLERWRQQSSNFASSE